MQETNTAPTLTDLKFSDIYIHLKSPKEKSYAFYKGEKGTKRTFDHKVMAIHAEKMAKIISDKIRDPSVTSFRIAYCNHLYRVTLIKSVDGYIAECRSQPRELIPLMRLGLPSQVRNWTLSERLCKGGLILVVGAVGSGKTTTCAAIAKARVEQYGGVLLTIEDPVELPMHGSIGNGLCIQYEIENQEDFLEAGRLALRCYPAEKSGILFIGEIRDQEAAALALRASIDGRLVVATMHGDSVIAGLKRFVSFCSDKMTETEVMSLLKDGFRLCLHQSLTKDRLTVQFLADTDSASKLLGQGRLDNLNTDIEAQEIIVKRNEKVILRQI